MLHDVYDQHELYDLKYFNNGWHGREVTMKTGRAH